MYDALIEDFEEEFFPYLRKTLEPHTVDNSKVKAKDLYAVCDYIDWARQSDVKLKFDLDDKMIQYMNAAQDRKLFFRHHAHREQEHLPNYELFLQLNEIVEILAEGKPWIDQAITNDYFKKTGVEDKETFPQFMLYLTHAEGLAPIFKGLGTYRMTRPAPGSAIFFEFYTEKDELFVKTMFKNSMSDDEEVFEIPSENTQPDGAIPVKDF
jgi:hypothetical protein